MRKADLVKRLRMLQGYAYGAYASATHYADRDIERPGGKERDRYPIMVGSLHAATSHLAKQLDELATDIEGSHRRAKLGKLRASVLACTLLLGIAGSARADAIYDIHPNMGAVIENNHTPCGADARAWLVTFVATLQVLVLGEREHIRLIYNDATHTPDYELEGDPLIGFWRGGKKTVFVSLQGDAVHPRLDIAFILRDADGTCYEKWEGLGLRR